MLRTTYGTQVSPQEPLLFTLSRIEESAFSEVLGSLSQEVIWRHFFFVQLLSRLVQCVPMVQHMPTVERPFVFIHWVR